MNEEDLLLQIVPASVAGNHPCYGLNCAPSPKRHIRVLTPVPQHVSLFRNRVIAAMFGQDGVILMDINPIGHVFLCRGGWFTDGHMHCTGRGLCDNGCRTD